VQVGRRREAEPAGERGGEIAEDVAEEVGRDDDVVACRVQHEVEGERVDVRGLVLDLRVLGRDLGEDAAPQVAGVWHGVRLVGERDLAAAGGAGVLERGAHDALDALARVDVLLDGDLVRRPALEVAAHPRVHALGVLADDDDVHVLGRHVTERRECRVEEADGPQVHVQVEVEAQAEQDLARVAVVRDARIAERAEEDRVVVGPEIVHLLRRDGGAGAQVTLGAEIPLHELERELGLGGEQAKQFDGQAGDLRADAVPGNHSDACHGGKDTGCPRRAARPRPPGSTSRTPRAPWVMQWKGYVPGGAPSSDTTHVAPALRRGGPRSWRVSERKAPASGASAGASNAMACVPVAPAVNPTTSPGRARTVSGSNSGAGAAPPTRTSWMRAPGGSSAMTLPSSRTGGRSGRPGRSQAARAHAMPRKTKGRPGRRRPVESTPARLTLRG